MKLTDEQFGLLEELRNDFLLEVMACRKQASKFSRRLDREERSAFLNFSKGLTEGWNKIARRFGLEQII